MSARRIGAAVVHDPDTCGLGIITERDILDAVGSGLDPDRESASAHTTTDVVFAAPAWTLEEAAEAMTHGGFRHLIVLDGDGPVGIVSVRDIIRCWAPVRRTVATMRLTPAPRRVRVRSAPERPVGRTPRGDPAHGRRQASGQPRRAWTAASSRLPKSPSAWRKLLIARSAMSSRETLAMNPARFSISRTFSSSEKSR